MQEGAGQAGKQEVAVHWIWGAGEELGWGEFGGWQVQPKDGDKMQTVTGLRT